MEYGTRMKGLKTGQFVDGRSGSLKTRVIGIKLLITKDKEFGALCVFRIRNNKRPRSFEGQIREVSQ